MKLFDSRIALIIIYLKLRIFSQLMIQLTYIISYFLCQYLKLFANLVFKLISTLFILITNYSRVYYCLVERLVVDPRKNNQSFNLDYLPNKIVLAEKRHNKQFCPIQISIMQKFDQLF